MKGKVLCPYCMEKGKHTVIGKYEDVVGHGELYLWCRWCRREVRISLRSISLDK